MPITTTPKIWMNGKLVDWDKAQVHVLTHTLHYGTGVFEGIRAYETKNGPAIFRLTDHIKRLYNSAKIMGMDMLDSLLARRAVGGAGGGGEAVQAGQPHRASSGLGSSWWRALRRLTVPRRVKAWPVRPERVGMTQSNMSMPRRTAPTRSAGLPTPIR